MKVRHIGLDVHDASDSLSDLEASSCVPLPHFKYGLGPCVRDVKVVYPSKPKNKSKIKIVAASEGDTQHVGCGQHLKVGKTNNF